MSVYKSFQASAAEYQRGAETLAQYLEDSGIFDSVTLDTTTYTVNCVYGGETIATFQFAYAGSSYYGHFYVTFGTYSADFNMYTSGAVLWVGKSANGVAVSCVSSNSGGLNARCILCKSQSGAPMLCASTGSNSEIALTYDAEATPTAESTTVRTSSFYSNLVGIATISSGTETVASPAMVFRYEKRQTNVPTDGMCDVNIGGTVYFTDGYFAIAVV